MTHIECQLYGVNNPRNRVNSLRTTTGIAIRIHCLVLLSFIVVSYPAVWL